MTDHPITPPPELVQQWAHAHFKTSNWTDASGDVSGVRMAVATQSARWGADQELEACCEWMYDHFQCGLEWSKDLRAARRPKPPSLKEQAIEELNELLEIARLQGVFNPPNTIRRALEQLDD